MVRSSCKVNNLPNSLMASFPHMLKSNYNRQCPSSNNEYSLKILLRRTMSQDQTRQTTWFRLSRRLTQLSQLLLLHKNARYGKPSVLCAEFLWEIGSTQNCLIMCNETKLGNLEMTQPSTTNHNQTGKPSMMNDAISLLTWTHVCLFVF